MRDSDLSAQTGNENQLSMRIRQHNLMPWQHPPFQTYTVYTTPNYRCFIEGFHSLKNLFVGFDSWNAQMTGDIEYVKFRIWDLISFTLNVRRHTPLLYSKNYFKPLTDYIPISMKLDWAVVTEMKSRVSQWNCETSRFVWPVSGEIFALWQTDWFHKLLHYRPLSHFHEKYN